MCTTYVSPGQSANCVGCPAWPTRFFLGYCGWEGGAEGPEVVCGPLGGSSLARVVGEGHRSMFYLRFVMLILSTSKQCVLWLFPNLYTIIIYAFPYRFF